jgi:hypothetical protein
LYLQTKTKQTKQTNKNKNNMSIQLPLETKQNIENKEIETKTDLQSLLGLPIIRNESMDTYKPYRKPQKQRPKNYKPKKPNPNSRIHQAEQTYQANIERIFQQQHQKCAVPGCEQTFTKPNQLELNHKGGRIAHNLAWAKSHSMEYQINTPSTWPKHFTAKQIQARFDTNGFDLLCSSHNKTNDHSYLKNEQNQIPTISNFKKYIDIKNYQININLKIFMTKKENENPQLQNNPDIVKLNCRFKSLLLSCQTCFY